MFQETVAQFPPRLADVYVFYTQSRDYVVDKNVGNSCKVLSDRNSLLWSIRSQHFMIRVTYERKTPASYSDARAHLYVLGDHWIYAYC